MKKIFALMFLTAILLFGKHAYAQDVYVGTSDATGRDCYVMNETIHWPNRYNCHVTLKMVRPSDSNVKLLNYTFMIMQHWTEFENSQGFKDRVSQNYPIELNMWRYIMRYSEQIGLRKP